MGVLAVSDEFDIVCSDMLLAKGRLVGLTDASSAAAEFVQLAVIASRAST